MPKRIILEAKRIILEAKRAILETKRTILEPKRSTIKEVFSFFAVLRPERRNAHGS